MVGIVVVAVCFGALLCTGAFLAYCRVRDSKKNWHRYFVDVRGDGIRLVQSTGGTFFDSVLSTNTGHHGGQLKDTIEDSGIVGGGVSEVSKSVFFALVNRVGRMKSNIESLTVNHSAAATALDQRIEATSWKPLESMPKDGTWCMCLRMRDFGPEVLTARWVDNGDGLEIGGKGWWYAADSMPSHWMPIDISSAGR